ncbi:DUF3098 domain-containing protein [Jiulongibacter sediminis]|uniref:DUF3098 domain-containing protein n=1 Tax=Jiulongibacter sediminis TaxID=1605367 RepID=A0A0P7BG00_9BACT|nr:DUF3098 domain-containing protein [Jiulongibacter sediminis]KPM49829.1 hypothetical protein AFM12_04440 [Jiulongibacter sediminis]
MSKKNRKNSKPETKVDAVIDESPKAKVVSTDSAAASELAFGKSNYRFMLIGIAVIIIGFFIMTQDKEEFGFGFMGITLGPIVVFLGFMIELYAILKKKA